MPPDQSELILSIRAAKEDRGLSCQQIVEACTASGDSVSYNSVQKVLTAPLEEAARCRAGTIRAISRAVIGEQSPDVEDHIASGIEDRNRQIRRLQSELDEKTRTIRTLTVWVFVVSALFLIAAGFLTGYLVWDFTHPTQGMIRY